MRYEPRFRTLSFRADDDDTDEGILSGLAVPFDSPTRIDSWWEGTFDEEFAPGAFKRTLDHKVPKLMFEHGYSRMLGEMPIGSWLDGWPKEEKRGLGFKARLFEDPVLGLLKEAIRAEQINSVSVRFRPIKIEVTEQEESVVDGRAGIQLQRVTEAELVELGPVVFPAYEGTELELRAALAGAPDELRSAALALLRGGRPDGLTVAHPPGASGTDPDAGSPAETDPVRSDHSDAASRARRLRLLTL